VVQQDHSLGLDVHHVREEHNWERGGQAGQNGMLTGPSGRIPDGEAKPRDRNSLAWFRRRRWRSEIMCLRSQLGLDLWYLMQWSGGATACGPDIPRRYASVKSGPRCSTWRILEGCSMQPWHGSVPRPRPAATPSVSARMLI
jgi:hypothetical protein